MFSLVLLACLPFSIPSLFLAFKIIQKNCLDSVFNQNILVLFLLTSVYTPLSISIHLWLLVTDPEQTSHLACGVLMSVRMFFIYFWFNSMYTAVHYRYIMVKYAGQGLVSQGSANLKLMKILYWVITLAFIAVAYGNMPLSKQMKQGFPENTAIGKICMRHDLHNSKENMKARLLGFAFPFLNLFGVALWYRKVRKFVHGQCLNKKTFSALGGRYRRNIFTYSETFKYNGLWATFIILENSLLIIMEVYSENISNDMRYALYHLLCFLFVDVFHGLYLPLKYLHLSRDQFPILWSEEEKQEQKISFYVRTPQIVPRRDFELENVPKQQLSGEEISRRTYFTPRFCPQKMLHAEKTKQTIKCWKKYLF